MADLTDRQSILRAFFRLVDSDATDGQLVEHDASTLEGVYALLREACDAAQEDVIGAGFGEFWLKRSTALSFAGTDAADGGRYADLPSDFWRAAGDGDDSALVTAKGRGWGREILPELRNRASGSFYYFRDGKLWITKGANLPSEDLFLEYYRRVATLADTVDADFPAPFRGLIPAHAAVEAVAEGWYEGDQIEEGRLEKLLERRKDRMFSRVRPSEKTRQIRPKAMTRNTHWWS